MRTTIRIYLPGPQKARGFAFEIKKSITLPNPVWQNRFDKFARIQEVGRRGISTYGWEFLLPREQDEVDARDLHDYNTRFAGGRVEAWIRDGLKAEQDVEYSQQCRDVARRTRCYGVYVE